MDKTCISAPSFLQSLDGSVIDMRHFNETLLLKSLECGKKEPFRTLVIVTSNTLDKVQEALARQRKTIGLIGLVIPEYKLVRIVKMAFNDETVVMLHRQTRYDFHNLKLECVNLPYPPVIDYACRESECQVSGMYPRIISHLGRIYNFSVAYHTGLLNN